MFKKLPFATKAPSFKTPNQALFSGNRMSGNFYRTFSHQSQPLLELNQLTAASSQSPLPQNLQPLLTSPQEVYGITSAQLLELMGAGTALLSLFVAIQATIISKRQILQSQKSQNINLESKGNDLVLKVIQSWQHAYTTNDNRLNLHHVEHLKSEVTIVSTEIKRNIENSLYYRSNFFPLQWKAEIERIKLIDARLLSYISLAQAMVCCQLKEYPQASEHTLNAFSDYMKVVPNFPSSKRDELISLLRRFFQYLSVFNHVGAKALSENEIRTLTEVNHVALSFCDLERQDFFSEIHFVKTMDLLRGSTWFNETEWYSGLVV